MNSVTDLHLPYMQSKKKCYFLASDIQMILFCQSSHLNPSSFNSCSYELKRQNVDSVETEQIKHKIIDQGNKVICSLRSISSTVCCI